MSERDRRIVTPEAVAFLERLATQFTAPLENLLKERQSFQSRVDAGEPLDFPQETANIREGDWRVAPIPQDLLDRRVEITAPAEPKMAVNALNSNAKAYMACFEDALSPSWVNLLAGQNALYDAVRRDLQFEDAQSGKSYKLNSNYNCVLIVRPRGLHLKAKHMLLDDKPIPGALMDFGLFCFHNAAKLLESGSGPYFYLPKIEHYREAAWWNEVFEFAEEYLGLPSGACKATILIETLPAVFEMDEILCHLRDRIVGLNCGRWDYIFSYIKTLRASADHVLPDRNLITMAVPFMNNYSLKLIQTCHKRGAHAMGGMSAFIPVRGNDELNRTAFEQVRNDKKREVTNGHDGTWVAHPDLIDVAMKVFDEHMPTPNQHGVVPNAKIAAADLLEPFDGVVTSDGYDANIQVALRYITSWLLGRGAVPIFNLMEDAATAEIARMQLWQWNRYGVTFEDGTKIDMNLFKERLSKAVGAISAEWGNHPATAKLDGVAKLLQEFVMAEQPDDFLTIKAYNLIK